MAETVDVKDDQPRSFGPLVKVGIALTVLVAYFLLMVTLSFLAQKISVPFQLASNSMSPAIQPNDRIMVNRLVYDSSPPERDEIIAFRSTIGDSSEGEYITYVKRVTGVPGDIVEVRDGQVLVNSEAVTVEGADRPRYELPPQVVPEGKIFVLGDNMNESEDSHVWGPISMSDVTGRVEYIYWPLSNLAVLSRSLAVSDAFLPAFFLFSISWPPIACSIVAAKRNRNALGWFFLGLMVALLSGILSIVPLTILFLLSPRELHATPRRETS